MTALRLAISFAALLVGAAARAQDKESAAREWSQAHGNASGTSRVDVAPIRGDPVVAWKKTWRQIDSDPVAWGGVVYAVGIESSGRKLFALDLATGAPRATPFAFGGTGHVQLAAWQGFLAAVETDGITVFQHHGTQLGTSREKKIPGSFHSPGCVNQGYLFVCDDRDKVVCVDLRTGKKVGSFAGGGGRPTVVPGDKPDEWIVATVGAGTKPADQGYYVGSFLGFFRTRVSRLDGKAPQFDTSLPDWCALLEDDKVVSSDLTGAFLAPMSAGKSSAPWLVFSPKGIKAESGPALHTYMTPRRLAPIATEPAVLDDSAFGFSADGSLIQFSSSGGYRPVLRSGALIPAGARRGRCTVARDVLYLENWAAEIEGGRVLWCKPDLEPSTALLPVGDGLALYTTKANDLVCLRDSMAGTPAASSVAQERRPSAPGSGDGVVTSDGRRLEGKVTDLGGGRIRIEGAHAPAIELPASEVSLVESGSSVRGSGDAYPVYRAFFSALACDALDSIDRLFDGYRRAGFEEECRRLLEETRVYDGDGKAAAGLEKRLGGVTIAKSSNSTAQLERLKKEETQMREALAASFTHAASWSKDHGMPLAAGSLLLDASRVLPDSKQVSVDAAALVPAGFPGQDLGGGPLAWLRMAKEVLPVSGAVLPPTDAAWEKVRAASWSARALGMRTKNLCLFSTESDPAIVGTCLRRGERAVRILAKLFAEARGVRAGSDDSRPLQVIVHKDRAEYLSASAGAGHPNQEWTAGFFSLAENLSRFFVPRTEVGAGVIDRDLDHVLVHELCHHFVHQRWLGSGESAGRTDSKRPGFWIVEGLAEFVADQVVEMDRRGERFDDETVFTIDASARLLEAGKLLGVADLLGMSQEDFLKLDAQPAIDIQLRHQIARARLSAKNVFYEEAASLVFYLVNRCDAKTGAAAIGCIAKWYGSGPPTEAWKDLGFESPAKLEEGFFAFLRESAH